MALRSGFEYKSNPWICQGTSGRKVAVSERRRGLGTFSAKEGECAHPWIKVLAMRNRSTGWIVVGLGLLLRGAGAEEFRASLEAQGVPLREVLGPLAWHTGWEIGLEGVGETPVTLCLRDQPLENLLELLSEAAGCQLVKAERGYLFHAPESTPEAASRVRQWLAGPIPTAPSRRIPHAPLAYRFLEEESEADFDLELRLTGQPWPPEEPVRLVFHFRDSQDYDGLLMGRQGIGFVRVRGGLVEPLGTAGEWALPAPGETVTLTLTCRGRERRALVNHELCAQAFEDSRPGNRIGYFLPAGVAAEEPLLAGVNNASVSPTGFWEGPQPPENGI